MNLHNHMDRPAPDNLMEPTELSHLYFATSLYKYLAPQLLQEQGILYPSPSPSPLLLKFYYTDPQDINSIMLLKENIQPGIMKNYILNNFFSLSGISKSLNGSFFENLPTHLISKILSYLTFDDIIPILTNKKTIKAPNNIAPEYLSLTDRLEQNNNTDENHATVEQLGQAMLEEFAENLWV